jgi:hypothetical protein
VVMDCHMYSFQFSKPAGEGLEGGDLRPNPGWFSGLPIRSRYGCAWPNLDVMRRPISSQTVLVPWRDLS